MGFDSQALGNVSGAHSITHNGKEYSFRLVDQAAKAEWEKRLYQKAVRAAQIMAELKPAGWLEAKLVELDQAFLGGDFSFFSEASIALLKTPGGIEILLTILTGLDLMQLAPLVVERSEEAKSLLHLVIRESFPSVKIDFTEEEGPKKSTPAPLERSGRKLLLGAAP